MTAAAPAPYAYIVDVGDSIPPYLLSARDAGRYLGYSERTVQRWLAEGRLPKVRCDENGKVFVRRIDLEAFADAHRTPPVSEPTHIHPLRGSE